ncbi:MAG: methyl-accepting chemotaxis protein [Betaproteobacteria bacterium]|nr:methyl-accepting chemotaxis protein [Betaproteobacteria bacterium]
MKIKYLFLMALATSWVSLLAISLIGLVNMEITTNNMEEVGEERLPKVLALTNLESNVNQMVLRYYEIISKEALAQDEQISELRRILPLKRTANQNAEKAFATYDVMTRNPEAQRIWDETRQHWNTWYPLLSGKSDMVERALANPTPENLAVMYRDMSASIEAGRGSTGVIRDNVTKLVEINQNFTTSLLRASIASQNKALAFQAVTSFAAIVIITLLFLRLLEVVFVPINQLVDAMSKIKQERDLSARVDYQSDNEMGIIVASFNQLTEDMQNSFNHVYAQIEKSIMAFEALVATTHQIADQTNLMALKAAIEATRANEHDHRFAMVAEEIRRLAESDSQSTGIVGAMSDHMRNAVKDMKEVVEDIYQHMENIVHEINESSAASEDARASMQSFERLVSAVKAAMARIKA